MVRDEILDRAKDIINGEREGTYGRPEDSFGVIATLWSGYLKASIKPEALKVALFLTTL